MLMSSSFAVRINLIVQEVGNATREKIGKIINSVQVSGRAESLCFREFLSTRVNCCSKSADFCSTLMDYGNCFFLGSLPCHFRQDGQFWKVHSFEQELFRLQSTDDCRQRFTNEKLNEYKNKVTALRSAAKMRPEDYDFFFKRYDIAKHENQCYANIAHSLWLSLLLCEQCL